MKVTGIHHVTLIVNDLNQAAWFYGEVLGLKEKKRPSFDFPGLFYLAGDRQEVHLILTSRPLRQEQLYIRWGRGAEMTARHIHRHAALRVSELPAFERRLRKAGVKILFSESLADRGSEMDRNLLEGWMVAYGGIPMFCEDPFGNLLELVPLD